MNALIQRIVLRTVVKLEFLPPRRRGNPLTNFLLQRTEVAINFDADYYLKTNRDLGDWRATPWQHYVTHGRFEYRSPNEELTHVGTAVRTPMSVAPRLIRCCTTYSGAGQSHDQLNKV